MTKPSIDVRRRLSPPVIALLLLSAAGLLESMHGYIGYELSGRPQFGYTLRGQPLTLGGIMARAMPSWIVLGLLAGLALRLTEKQPLFSTRWKRSLLFHLPVAALFSAVFLVLAAGFRHFLFVGPEAGVSFGTTVLRYYTVYFNTQFLFYWGIVGLYSGFIHYRDLRERDLQAEKLHRKLTEARLRALQQQLEPHFLFNTLNAVSGLAIDGNIDGTVKTLSLLGELLRSTLRRSDQIVSLSEELQLLDLYLSIQKIRLEERLEVRMRIDPEARAAAVPTLMLQPLVENAIRHGVARESREGWVEITARRHGQRLRVTVTDSGPGPGVGPVHYGLGLRNCLERLEQLYGPDHALTLENAPGAGARLIVEWPWRTLPAAEPAFLADRFDAVPASTPPDLLAHPQPIRA